MTSKMKRTRQLAAAFDQRPLIQRAIEKAEREAIEARTDGFVREVMETLATPGRRAWQ